MKTTLILSVLALIVHVALGNCCVYTPDNTCGSCRSYGGAWCSSSSGNCSNCSGKWCAGAAAEPEPEPEPEPVNHYQTGNTLTEHMFEVNSVQHYFYASNWDQTQCANYINCDTTRFTITALTEATTHTIFCANFGHNTL